MPFEVECVDAVSCDPATAVDFVILPDELDDVADVDVLVDRRGLGAVACWVEFAVRVVG